MKRVFIHCLVAFSLILTLTVEPSNARIGGGRTFGTRGSRGFSGTYVPRNAYRSYESPSYSKPPSAQPNFPSYSTPTRGPSTLRTLGAGLAGGFLGSMLFRSMGNSYGMPYSHSGGGVGPLEILLLAGLLFFLFRLLNNRSQSPVANLDSVPSRGNGAEQLMRQAKSTSWQQNYYSVQDSYPENSRSFGSELGSQPISPELAMDLFFQIQGAWKNRDLTNVRHLLADDAQQHLQEEVTRLKIAHQINCLENIAVRNTDIVESWNDSGMNYTTIRFTANLLDYTINEISHEIISGNKETPVKFEELWTFSKDPNGNHWKLSAIQQT